MPDFSELHMRFFHLLFAVAALSTLGCNKAAVTNSTSAETTPQTASEIGKSLNPNMTDAEVLNALGLSISDFDSEFVQGKDGTQYNYLQEGQSVKIVRSIVTGVRVTARGSKLTGSWHLGPHPDTPIRR